MKKGILVAGGDMRQIYCAARLSDKYDISVTGFDSGFIPEELNLKIAENTEKSDCLILPVAALDSEGFITASCTDKKINPYDIKKMLSADSVIFAGKVSEKLKDIFSESEIIDYIESEELSLKNAVPTAEGAVQIALEELPVTLNGLKVLIIGMGRIGTALAGILRGFGADTTAAVRNERGAAKAAIAGIKSVRTENAGTDYALVFNTVPSLVLDRDILEKFGSDTLFIDLASKPGGIDFSAAAELGRKVIWALGLPGKTAPVTAGEIIAETVDDILSERGGYDV